MNAAFNSKTEDSPRTSPRRELEARLEAAARVSAAHFERMLDYLSYLPASDIELVRQAWHYADKAHTNQWRSSGDPYITHPIAVTTICAHWKLDAPALMAALLHDAMEDCGITKARFGRPLWPCGGRFGRWPDQTGQAALQHPRRKPGRIISQNAPGHGQGCARHPDQTG